MILISRAVGREAKTPVHMRFNDAPVSSRSTFPIAASMEVICSSSFSPPFFFFFFAAAVSELWQQAALSLKLTPVELYLDPLGLAWSS